MSGLGVVFNEHALKNNLQVPHAWGLFLFSDMLYGISMGKRSDFQRRKNDLYDTPKEAVIPLLEWLKNEHSEPVSYIEPCVGNNKLVEVLSGPHTCMFASDYNMDGFRTRYDATNYSPYPMLDMTDYFITNPPWTRKLLHPIIENLSNQRPTWLLFDSDWKHTKQAIPYLNRLALVLSVGRVKWIPNSKYVGKDNTCWYLFDKPDDRRMTQFIGRIP